MNTSENVNEYLYIPQNISVMNYNNMTSGYHPYVITSNAIYYSYGQKFKVSYCNEINELGEKHLFTANFDGAMAVDNRIFYSEWATEQIKVYDIEKGTIQKIYDFPVSGNITSFFVLNNVVYANCIHFDDNKKYLYAIDINSNEVRQIADNIYSVGVIGSAPHYIIKNGKFWSVFKYDYITDVSELVGSFEKELYHDSKSANYTSSAIILQSKSPTDYEFYLHIYDLNTKTLETRLLELPDSSLPADYVDITAFDKYCFIEATYYPESEKQANDDSEIITLPEDGDTNSLYRYCLETGEIDAICTFKKSFHSYVASDEDIYIILNRTDIRRYSPDGAYESVVVKK